jgi:hypothetical protein
MAYRLYIVGPKMTRDEFEREKGNLAFVAFGRLEDCLAAAEEVFDAGLNPMIEWDEGFHLGGDPIRNRLNRRN